ncbi:MAG: CMP/dCMP kinase [Actinomycetota bacterium]|nr:CMP/dCMP kinase [Actinomycetota bacterium]
MSTASPLRVIALDGPSGSGKSTVARGVARALALPYVDTGATYRAATLAALRAGALDVAPEAVDSVVADVVAAADITLSTDPDDVWVRLGGEDVSAEIRGPEVTAAVSAVSAVPAVRERMVALQRRLARNGAVVEGRDIGTVVAPDAPVKVFLDAAPEVRAARRAGEAEVGVRATGDVLEAVAVDLARRDRLDSTRTSSPLQAAPDAVHLDSSELSAGEVVQRVLELARRAGFGTGL